MAVTIRMSLNELIYSIDSMLFVFLERAGPTGILWHARVKNGDVTGTRSSKSMISGTFLESVSFVYVTIFVPNSEIIPDLVNRTLWEAFSPLLQRAHQCDNLVDMA
ncbi:unnamed protein product [Nippostrongylus brasiliensis]|uniref:Secreted protein n=1 Tax=Nippostrongylus brasiliensis TaxID=27835 RepID=A0A0N4YCB0_NIPBR|nr:unnamed protein product [Nippostrongylus brasiliensis]